jgi:signal transduction histidine kinase
MQSRILLQPLMELVQAARRIGQGDGEDFRAVKRSDDEVGVLVESFNEMFHQIAERTRELHDQVNAKERARAELVEAQQRLISLSRQSGMAEIASSVLHNVGNVLNSVNVSATMISEKVKASRIDKLAAAVRMLQEHTGDMNSYMQFDAKGKQVLPYLAKLGAHFKQEQTAMLGELDLLTKHIGHIKQIVSMQQNYAKVSGFTEEISLPDLVEDALRIMQPGPGRDAPGLMRDFEDVPQLHTNKHEILQILLNLLRNAKRAVADAGKAGGMIRVRIRRHGPDHVRLEIKDSGVGLSNENLTRIFAHGFTTKADGHGFGLHSGALAARQLGGSLWAESEGPGCGATFTLELPLCTAKSERGVSYELANAN